MRHTTPHFLTRRRLLQHSALGVTTAAAMTVFPRPLTAMLGGRRPEPIPPIQDKRIKELVQRGIDAARSAGATYADVRMTYTWDRSFWPQDTMGGMAQIAYTDGMQSREFLHASVRALINGYWGFAASPVWSPEELVRLGREAARQASMNLLGKSREVVLPPTPAVRDGHWETPLEIDPFALAPEDILDYLAYLQEQLTLEVGRLHPLGKVEGNGAVNYGFWRQAKAFGSTDGSYCTQLLTRSSGSAVINHRNIRATDEGLLSRAGVGWELVRKAPIIETLLRNLAHAKEMARLPVKPVDVGRYTAVFNTGSVTRLTSGSLGEATRIDRAFGYEANGRGTSYLVEPEEMLGAYQVGTPALTITANRSDTGGCATTRWDDEGVEPASFTMIDRGVVTDYQTSREGAGWLKGRYEQLGRPFRSNGCTYASTANDALRIGNANLVMQPDARGGSYEDLEAGVERGISVVGMIPSMDFQLTSGYSSSVGCYELKNGKRVARIHGAGLLFRTSEIWKSILSIGGPQSQHRFGMLTGGGTGDHSVTAVPVVVKDVTFIDRERR